MSYHHNNQYARPPPIPPRPSYHEQQQQQQQQQQQYDQYGQRQNGGYTAQYGHPQYPGQPTYTQSQAGGPVQQPQANYPPPPPPPPNNTYSPTYGTQQYQPIPAYNPQQYSPQLDQGQRTQYNPQAYSNLNTTPYPSQYNPAAYPQEPAVQATSGPLGDPYPYTFESPSPTEAEQHPPPQPLGHYNGQQSYQSPQTSHSPYNHQSPARQTYQSSPPPVQSPYLQGNLYSPATHHSQQQGHTGMSPAVAGSSNETWMPSPPTYHINDGRDSPAQTTSLPSPASTTPGPTPPIHNHMPSRTDTLTRHPQSRPLPGPPESDADSDYLRGNRPLLTRQEAEDITQEELFAQVESAVLNAGREHRSPSVSVTPAPVQPPHSIYSVNSPRHNDVGINGHLAPRDRTSLATEAQLSDESDAEAAAGLEAMRMDDEREAAEDARRRSSGPNRYAERDTQQTSQPPPPPSPRHGSDSDDYRGVDVSMYGGGYDVHMSYSADPNQLTVAGGEANGDAPSQPVSSQHSSMRRSHASQSSRGEHVYTPGSVHSFSPFNPSARVDAGGTGGNYEPTADGRRPSFDEGDEYTFTEGQLPERFPDEPPDIFYHPATTNARPLPPPPPPPPHAETLSPHHTDAKVPSPYAPDEYSVDAQGRWVPRSASLTSHSNTPQVPQPLRSKTDAEERRKQLNRHSGYSSAFDTTPSNASAVALDLPSLAAKRFEPAKLGAPDFRKCEEPWALSAILQWLVTVTTPERTTELRESAIMEALVNLFTNKVPTMNIADAEGLSTRVVEDMYQAGTLQTTEEWVKIVAAPMSGVIFQLTASGCYSPTLHDHMVPGRCYAPHCQRTLRKVNLSTHPVRTTEAWAEFYKLKVEDLEGRDKKEIERQNVLHEVVQTEELFMEQLNTLRTVYRDPLTTAEPSIVTPKRKVKFIKDVFGRVDAIKQANEDHLLPQLKYRQQEQGPWIVGFSDIFRQWIRKAKNVYIEYAAAFPGATFMVRQEMERNMHFAQFLDRARVDTRSHKLGWDTYLKAPITRLQRYSLLLNTVLKTMKTDSEEKKNLQLAYDEVKMVTLECDHKVADMQKKVDLADLSSKLVLRPGMQNAVELNLTVHGRELIHRGDLQRMGGNRFTWLDSHAILFDHYLVLAKTVAQRADQGGKFDKYDVSRLPIPMDLLMLESTNDPAVQKSSYVKGISTVSAVTARTASPNDPNILTKINSTQSVPNLQHVNTGNSQNSIHTVTTLDSKDSSERILYPFRVKHLGRENYTLFAYSEQSRRDWCNKIIEAKTKHAAALFSQHAEPFRLRVMADSAFVQDSATIPTGRSVQIKGTPVDRAIKEVAHRFKDTGRPGPVCRARVNCATSFTTPYPGKQMVAVGTDFGVFISEIDNPRGWTKALTLMRVTQIAVLEEFNLFILIAEKSLIAFHLDVVYPGDRNGPAPPNDSVRKAPQKLSGSRDVGFFVIGRMKDRTLVFYKKRENLSSTFKVLEPVYQKSTEKKRGIFKRGTTEFFREYDEFYIPTECTGINLFHSSLAVSTARGFEVLTLDRKQPASVPDLKPEHVQNIARHLKDQRALCMLRISDQEFLLCYANCAVYINKHGDVSRSVIMEFVGNAQTVAMYGAYLILFDNDFVEIRNAQNGRLKQIIAGNDVKCLDDGGCWTAGNNNNANGASVNTANQRTVKFTMQHPEMERTQIVVELVLNENMRD